MQSVPRSSNWITPARFSAATAAAPSRVSWRHLDAVSTRLKAAVLVLHKEARMGTTPSVAGRRHRAHRHCSVRKRSIWRGDLHSGSIYEIPTRQRKPDSGLSRDRTTRRSFQYYECCVTLESLTSMSHNSINIQNLMLRGFQAAKFSEMGRQLMMYSFAHWEPSVNWSIVATNAPLQQHYNRLMNIRAWNTSIN